MQSDCAFSSSRNHWYFSRNNNFNEIIDISCDIRWSPGLLSLTSFYRLLMNYYQIDTINWIN